MKAIQINFEGNVKPYFATIARKDEKLGFCYISEKTFNFIRAQSIDGMVYYGTEPVINIPSGIPFDMEPSGNISCSENGDISTYYVKGHVYDESDPFAPAKEGEWEWRAVELRIINIME